MEDNKKKFIDMAIEKIDDCIMEHPLTSQVLLGGLTTILLVKWGYKEQGKAISKGVKKGIEEADIHWDLYYGDFNDKKSKRRRHR